jgi:hypothetical protein
MKAPENEPPPFPFLITRKQLTDDARIWGVDDWHYKMMDEAMMPRGQGSRRVLTRQMCVKFGAFQQPLWRDSRRTRIAFLDAAYRGVGGDRCVFGELQFGPETEGKKTQDQQDSPMVVQDLQVPEARTIIALVDQIIVPIRAEVNDEPAEDQIVRFVMDQCANRAISPDNFFFDSGMRTSLVTAFSRLWTPNVNSIDCGGKPSEERVSQEINMSCRDYYSKFITELWYSVRLAVEAGQVRGFTEELVTEFSAREWKLVAGNKIEVETKQEMRDKCGRSPDLADSCAIGFFGAKMRGFLISRELSSASESGPDWRDELRQRSRKLHKSGCLTYA